MTVAWEVEFPVRKDGGPRSVFFEKKYDAVDEFFEATCRVWHDGADFLGGDVNMYRLRIADLPRRSLVVALLNRKISYTERTLIDGWMQTQGCPNIDNEKLLLEYLGGDCLESLAARYGIGRSTVHDRLMKAREKQG